MNKLKMLFNNPSRGVLIFILVFVFSLALGLFFQQKKLQKQMELKVQFIEEKNMLRDDLDDLIDKHDELLYEYGDLNNQLQEKDSVIQQKITEIRDLIRTKNDLNEARKKITILKSIAKKYLSNIDSLLVVNENLTIEKDSVIRQNQNINWKNYKLNKQNKKLAEKVSRGSVLELIEFEIKTIRFRNSGREVNTRFAKKVQKIRICYKIGSNKISDAEEKQIFMQLINPNGELIVGNEQINTTILDSVLICTATSLFFYQNKEMNDCFEWERVHPLEPGNYLINLIIEGRVAGQKSLNLR